MAESTIFSRQFLNEASEILKRLDTAAIDRAIALLAKTRRRNGMPLRRRVLASRAMARSIAAVSRRLRISEASFRNCLLKIVDSAIDVPLQDTSPEHSQATWPF